MMLPTRYFAFLNRTGTLVRAAVCCGVGVAFLSMASAPAFAAEMDNLKQQLRDLQNRLDQIESQQAAPPVVPAKMLRSGKKQVTLSLSGQVNRVSMFVDDGTLNMNDNNLRIASLSEASGGDNPGVEIAGGATARGTGTAFIEVEEPAVVPKGLAKTAGPVGFANTSDGCFVIEGAGDLMMAFDKTTNAGVCIDLDEIGAGGFSFNRAGTLFVREALQLNGSFLNQSKAGTGLSMISGARTEFWKLKTITRNLEIVGPGLETYDDGTHFVNAPGSGFPNVIDPAGAAHCESGRFGSGNESGVYFFQGVTIEGDLVMTDTDDPLTT
ncbi:MAG: hypothetical protein IH926_09535, partial [Proteobacteria bacterium]|nr:hypothetical protein [Pseudomonadota bacterium]